MKHGPGWVLFEESFHNRTKKLISILPPRKGRFEITRLVEQQYIDRYGSIDEKLAYKKNRDRIIHPPLVDNYTMIIHCGHEPYLVCIFAKEISLKGKALEIIYSIAVDRSDPMNPIWEDRQQTITLEE